MDDICDVCFHPRPLILLKDCMHGLVFSTVCPNSTDMKLQKDVVCFLWSVNYLLQDAAALCFLVALDKRFPFLGLDSLKLHLRFQLHKDTVL